MELTREKNVATTIIVPMIGVTAPETFLTGLTVADDAYYNDGAGWVALPIADDFTEIGATGSYSVDMTTAEMNHDLMYIKLTAAGAADSSMIIYTGNSGDVVGVRNMEVESAGGITLQQAIDLILAVNVGVSTNNGLTFQDPSGTTVRVEAVVDDDANRTSVTITPSS